MPLYDYFCQSCGEFRRWAPMAQSGTPQPCPKCHTPAPRTVSAPHMRCGDATSRYKAEAHNERNANEPEVVRHVGQFGSHEGRHGHKKHDHSHKHIGRSRQRPWMVGH